MTSLQKANVGKRIIASIFDGILISILAVGIIALLSGAFKTDDFLSTYQKAYTKYSSEYDVALSLEEYNALSDQEKTDYNTRAQKAEEAFAKDSDAMYAYNMFVNLSLISVTFGVLISVILIEFIVPLFFGNGQTLGKKIFGIALMHKDGIKVGNMQLFARAVLGKFAIELMIPIYIIFMILLNSIGIISVAILLALLIVEFFCFFATRTNSLLHDVLSGTIAVDMASQRIFDNKDALLEYTKKHHAQKANANVY